MEFDFGQIKRHPALIIGVVAVGGLLLYLYFRSGSSGGSQSSGGTTVIRQGPSDAVQMANIQSGTALQLAQAQQTAQQTQLSAALTGQTNTLNAQTTQQQTAVKGAVDIAGLQAGIQNNQTAAALAAVQAQTAAQFAAIHDNNITQTAQQNAAIAGQIQLAAITTAAATTQQANQLTAQQNIQYSNNGVLTHQLDTQSQVLLAGIDAQTQQNKQNQQTALGIVQSNNQTQQNRDMVSGAVAINSNNNQTSVANNYISTGGQVQINQQDNMGRVAGQAIAAQQNEFQNIVNLTALGKLNKGGEGGANQVSVLAAAMGQPGVGVAAQQTQQANQFGGNSIGAILSGIGKVAATIF